MPINFHAEILGAFLADDRDVLDKPAWADAAGDAS
jgi:hypothetical protein